VNVGGKLRFTTSVDQVTSGPAAIDVYGTITFIHKTQGETIIINWTGNPVTTFRNGSMLDTWRTNVRWYDPVYIAGNVTIDGATGGRWDLYSPLSGASNDAHVVEIKIGGGGYAELHAENAGFAGTFLITSGAGLRVSHADALNGVKMIDVNNGTFGPFVMPDPGDPYPEIVVRSNGTYGLRYGYGETPLGPGGANPEHTVDITLAGGRIVSANSGVSLYSGTLTVISNSKVQVEGTSGDIRIGGAIVGDKKLTFDCGNSRMIYVRNTNNVNTWSGELFAYNQPGKTGWVIVETAGAQGSGTISISGTSSPGQLRFKDMAGPTHWVIANDVAGAGVLRVEDGSGNYTLTTSGALSPGTSASACGILTIDGDLCLTNGASVNVKILGTNNVVGTDYDRLKVDHDLTGLANAVLNVQIATNLTVAQLSGQSFVVVTNASALSGGFSSVRWSAGWAGSVSYDNNCVTLSDLRPAGPAGTMIMVE